MQLQQKTSSFLASVIKNGAEWVRGRSRGSGLAAVPSCPGYATLLSTCGPVSKTFRWSYGIKIRLLLSLNNTFFVKTRLGLLLLTSTRGSVSHSPSLQLSPWNTFLKVKLPTLVPLWNLDLVVIHHGDLRAKHLQIPFNPVPSLFQITAPLWKLAEEIENIKAEWNRGVTFSGCFTYTEALLGVGFHL